MNLNELESLLAQSLQDFKLDDDEKNRFSQLAEILAEEKVRFISLRKV